MQLNKENPWSGRGFKADGIQCWYSEVKWLACSHRPCSGAKSGRSRATSVFQEIMPSISLDGVVPKLTWLNRTSFGFSSSWGQRYSASMIPGAAMSIDFRMLGDASLAFKQEGPLQIRNLLRWDLGNNTSLTFDLFDQLQYLFVSVFFCESFHYQQSAIYLLFPKFGEPDHDSRFC